MVGEPQLAGEAEALDDGREGREDLVPGEVEAVELELDPLEERLAADSTSVCCSACTMLPPWRGHELRDRRHDAPLVGARQQEDGVRGHRTSQPMRPAAPPAATLGPAGSTAVATSLPPPGASRPRPPPAPPSAEPRAPRPSPEPAAAPATVTSTSTSTSRPGAPRPAPPGPRPSPVARRRRQRRPPPPGPHPARTSTFPTRPRRGRSRPLVGRGAVILLIGFGLVAVALGVIANQAWLMGIPQSWVWWSSIAVVPPGLTALAALFGRRDAPVLAVAASVCTVVLAAVGLLRQPPVGLPRPCVRSRPWPSRCRPGRGEGRWSRAMPVSQRRRERRLARSLTVAARPPDRSLRCAMMPALRTATEAAAWPM